MMFACIFTTICLTRIFFKINNVTIVFLNEINKIIICMDGHFLVYARLYHVYLAVCVCG